MFRSVVSKTARLFSKLPHDPRLKNVQDRELYTRYSDGFSGKTAPFKSVYNFFHETLLPLGFRSDEEITVFDAGCATGFITKELIAPMFPNMKRAFAVDAIPESIEWARAHHAHPKVEYTQANIADWNSIMVWDGLADKLFSIYSLQWIPDQPQAFRNLRQIMRPGGEGAMYMVLNSQFYTACEIVRREQKWSRYFKGIGEYLAVAHKNRYNGDYYRELTEGLGFTVLLCEEKVNIDQLPSEQIFRDFFGAICLLTQCVPFQKKEEFKDDLFELMVRIGGRTSTGLPLHTSTNLELVIKKGKD